MNLDEAILGGRICNEIALRHTNSGTPVCAFTVAVDEGWGENKKTNFINVVCWNKTAELVDKHFKKGSSIIVVGRISTRTWEGQDGKKNYVTEVVANKIDFPESKKQSENNGDNTNVNNDVSYEDNYDTDEFVEMEEPSDLPF